MYNKYTLDHKTVYIVTARTSECPSDKDTMIYSLLMPRGEAQPVAAQKQKHDGEFTWPSNSLNLFITIVGLPSWSGVGHEPGHA